ncbi:hypothetical protein P9210_13985, partial [Heyndrickxia coagulans]|nr:hypothetical protein [Heyndrickxia coagulans]
MLEEHQSSREEAPNGLQQGQKRRLTGTTGKTASSQRHRAGKISGKTARKAKIKIEKGRPRAMGPVLI